MLSTFKSTFASYLSVVLLIFAFVTYPGATSDAKDPVVCFFNGYPIFLAFGVSVIYMPSLLLKGFIKDKISLLLFARIIVCLIPILYLNSLSSFSSHYPVVLLTFVAYCIGRTTKWRNEHLISNIIVLFGIVLSIQVIITFQNIPIDYFDLSYKSYMRIPIAASNVIASYITPILFLFIFNYRPKKIVKITIALLFIVSIIVTKSRGGVVVLILTYLTYLVLIKYKNKKRYLIPSFVVIGVCMTYLASIPEVEMFLLGFSADTSSLDANSLSSNRLELFGEEFTRFLQHPLFGNGMVFNSDTSKSGAHNLIIELLAQSGLIGTILFTYPICIVLKHSFKDLQNKNSIGWFLFIIATLYHGMIEVNFFNYSTDILFWGVCGLVMSRSQSNI